MLNSITRRMPVARIIPLGSVVFQVGLAFWGGLSTAKPLADRTLTDLLTLLRARDRAISRLHLPYTERPTRIADGMPLWVARGWWTHDRSRLAAFRSFETSFEGRQELPWEWSVWNGSRARTVRGEFGPGEQLAVPAPQRTVIMEGVHVGGCLSYDIGGPMGLFYWHSFWPDFLQNEATDVQVVGREQILGRDCLAVLFDRVPDGEDDGAYTNPTFAWFDDLDTLLAIRVQQYDNLARLAAKGTSLIGPDEFYVPEPLGEQWIPVQYNDIHETRRLEHGVHVGTRATRGFIFRHPQVSADVEIRVDVDKIGWGDVMLDWCFDLPVEYPLTVRDGIAKRVYVLGDHDSREHFTREDLGFWSLMQDYARRIGGEPSAELVHHPFHQSSCGLNTILFYACAYNEKASLEEMLKKVPDKERAEGKTPIERIKWVALEVGLAAALVHSEVHQLAAFDRGVVVHMREHGAAEPAHFAIAWLVADAEEVLLLAPPLKIEKLPRSEFEGLWTGGGGGGLLLELIDRHSRLI